MFGFRELIKMQYRKLGKTGLKVSKLGFGGIPIRDVSEKQALDVVNLV